jgi:hypothetical protein
MTEILANHKIPKRVSICPERLLLPAGKVGKLNLKAQTRERHATQA